MMRVGEWDARGLIWIGFVDWDIERRGEERGEEALG